MCKRWAIHFALIYILALVPAVHDVINCPRILNPQLARYGQPLPARPKSANSEDLHVQIQRVGTFTLYGTADEG
jgi:hypothetical protein